jgi:hypothetical protein
MILRWPRSDFIFRGELYGINRPEINGLYAFHDYNCA